MLSAWAIKLMDFRFVAKATMPRSQMHCC